MRNSSVKGIALSSMLAAVSLVIMCLGGLIPFATYVCPMLCALVGYLVLRFCGRKLAWVWYVVVSILSLLMGPDKEAAGVFVVLGYYPILKPIFDRSRFQWLWKLLLFNGAVTLLYAVVLRILGLEAVSEEFTEFGTWGLIIMLTLGNVTFILLDKLLNIMGSKLNKKHGRSA